MTNRQSSKPSKWVKDLSGNRFTRLTVTAYVGINKHRASLWECRCDCGQICITTANHLKAGDRKSCGCYQLQAIGDASRKHGRSGTKEYMAWCDAKQRCFQPNDVQYPDYGGRGITMCEEWRVSFDSFFSYIGPSPANMTLERINNDGNYEPGNVRWATPKEQAANRRPKCRH